MSLPDEDPADFLSPVLLVIQVSFSLSPPWEALSGPPAQLVVVLACLPLIVALIRTCNDLFFLLWLVSCLSFPEQKPQPSWDLLCFVNL